MMMRTRLLGACCLVSTALAAAGEPLSIGEAVRRAAERYPAVGVSAAQAAAAAEQIRVARLAYLPRVDALAQANRATRNNIFGMLLPQPGWPSISGPPLMENNLTSVWGSAVGLTVAWEPLDFGYRRAQVSVAEAGERRAQATLARTRFEVAAFTADAYLTLLAARQTERAAAAVVRRAETLVGVVEALVNAELRAGADLSRIRAELAAGRTQRIQAQRAIESAAATLAELTGTAVEPVEVLEASAYPGAAAEHPRLTEQHRAIDEAQARVDAVAHSVYPHFAVQAASYARGTGAMPDGRTLGGINGLGPNIHNWGIGVSLSVPLSEYLGLGTRKAAEAARERTERAQLEQVRRELSAREQHAAAALKAAQAISQQTPVLAASARDAESQALARYRAGLGTLAEVAEAQRLLAQAEIDEALARLAIWRAQVALASARGDLAPVLGAMEGK